MAWVGAVVSGIGSIVGASQKAKAAKKADQRLQEGRDYAINKSGLGDFRDAGVKANDTISNLLNIGGANDNTQASQAAFDNYLNSTGYRSQMKQGQDAIASSAAARGLLNSGSTLKALTKFGQGTGSQYFNDYLNQAGQVANRGEQAASDLAHTVTGTAGASAQVLQSGGNAAADTLNQGFQNAADYLGYQSQDPSDTDKPASVGTSISNIFNRIFNRPKAA
jgi:hypothetical protein